MEQATATTPPTPLPVRDSYEHAASVSALVVGPLQAEPSSVRIQPTLPSGWDVTILFLAHQAAGLYEVAARLDSRITHAVTDDGEVHAETIARLHDIEVRAAVLMPADQAARVFTDQAAASFPQPAPMPVTVPLGASVLAAVPAVTTTPAVNTAQLDTEDVAACVRCGCTEDAACEGGCYWVPNQQMADLCSACTTPEELQAMTYTAQGTVDAQQLPAAGTGPADIVAPAVIPVVPLATAHTPADAQDGGR